MEQRSKELLRLEHKNTSLSSLGLYLYLDLQFRRFLFFFPSLIMKSVILALLLAFVFAESALLVCEKDSSPLTKKRTSDGTPLTAPVPRSQLLGKVKDFLGAMSEANQRLELDAKDNPMNYDIEELTGNESKVIEMDLMLGVADLHTPEAVAAAESAISSFQPVIPLAADSSETDTDKSSSDDDNGDNESSDDEGDDDGCHRDGTKSFLERRPTSGKDNTISKQKGNNHSKKRPKIVELS